MVKRQPCWRAYFPSSIFPDKCCNVLCCRGEEEEDDEEVIVHMNDTEANRQYNYPNNFISPVSPATAIAPLVIVLAVALIKEGIEDIKRHQADARANSVTAAVLRNGELVETKSRHIMAGDVIRIDIGDEIRADVILLSASGEEGQAFIDTCNLDGETNLKSRKAHDSTWHLNSVEAFMQTKAVLHTSAPDPGLLSWGGMLEMNGGEYAMSLDQFLYRGSVLRNTDWAWGVVAYAGIDTKMFRNLKERPPKSSNLDRKLNILIVVIFCLQLVSLLIICSLACWWNAKHRDHEYLEFFINKYRGVRLWGYRFLTYFILLSYFVPISLFVTTELCKVIQAQWMRIDCHMMEYMGERWRHCQPNTSNLNEQLAMVRFIFSDKTGTLTENVMKFKKGDVLGFSFDTDEFEECTVALEDKSPNCEQLREYFLALSLCNTIQPFKDDTKEFGIVYEGSSPDEVALVNTAAEAGFRLLQRSTRSITILLRNDVRKTFSILATLEFTPDRKMMSIIVEDPETKKITLFNKGADSFVKPQLSKAADVQAHVESADNALTDMSSTGLRTLMVCAKDITRAEFDEWNAKFMAAGKLLQNRSEAVDKVCLEMEKDMRLIGCTAIEDKLQDQVPETLSFFLSAGVVVWMLTGDKRETAVTIAATSTLCDPRRDFVDHIDIGILDPKSDAAVSKVGADLKVVEEHVSLRGTAQEKRCTFVVDGPALGIAMEHYFDLFLELSQRVNSAVCCRLTPIQKANVVHMFQKSTGLTALAVGDGANDVSMIQEGRVGVGIIGLEGAQAALAADYAVPRFKHLRRLCAVHGRYSLVRNASCIVVSFYKNLIVSVIQIIYSFYAGFSGQTLLDGWLLTFFNVVLTSIPPFFMGIFEKDLPEEALMERPKLYTRLASGLYFNVPLLGRWGCESLLHAFMLFYVQYPTLRRRDGAHHLVSGSMVGSTIFCGMVLVVLTRFCIQIRYWQWLQLVGIVLSILLFLAIVLIYSAIPSLFGATSFYMEVITLMQTAKYWFYMLFYVSVVLIVDLTAIAGQKHFFPTLEDVAERQYALQHDGAL